MTEPLLKFELAHLLIHQPLTMSAMTREEILDELISLGELPPQSWSNAEMKLRMEELRVAKGLNPNPRAKEKTPLRQMMIRLNAASNKKQDLVNFVRDELKVPISTNDTIALLKKKGIMAIYHMAPPSAMDPVGFGTHTALHYQELKQTQPEYCKWVVQTAQAGPSHFDQGAIDTLPHHQGGADPDGLSSTVVDQAEGQSHGRTFSDLRDIQRELLYQSVDGQLGDCGQRSQGGSPRAQGGQASQEACQRHRELRRDVSPTPSSPSSVVDDGASWSESADPSLVPALGRKPSSQVSC